MPQPRTRELSWIDPGLSADAQRQLTWAADSIFAGTPATSLALWLDDGSRTVLVRGKVPDALVDADIRALVVPGPLLRKAVAKASGAPEYLPALQILPGRVEFGYFPELTQALLIVPLPGRAGACVIGADRSRCFEKEDVEWVRAVAARVGRVVGA